MLSITLQKRLDEIKLPICLPSLAIINASILENLVIIYDSKHRILVARPKKTKWKKVLNDLCLLK